MTTVAMMIRIRTAPPTELPMAAPMGREWCGIKLGTVAGVKDGFGAGVVRDGFVAGVRDGFGAGVVRDGFVAGVRDEFVDVGVDYDRQRT